MKYTVKKKNIYYTVGRYRLDNKQDAEHLCQTLNDLTTATHSTKDTDKKLDKINKQLIQINMTLKVLEDEINTLSELVKQ